MATILVVEDEPRLRRIIADYLSAKGFAVIEAGDGLAAVKKAQQLQPDLAVLDIMLPGLDGLSAARRIREHSSVPIIMLTAKGAEEDKLKGFEAGTDDYMVKPFSLRELEARIAVALRRGGSGSTSGGQSRNSWSHLGFTVDENSQQIWQNSRELPVTSLQYRLLHLLMSRPGMVFSRSRIIDHLSSDLYEGLERTVDAHVKNIRKIIEHDPSRPRYLLTRRGGGYYFARE